MTVPLGLDGCAAIMGYDEVTRALLTSLKNRNRRDVVAWLADTVVRIVPVPRPGTVVTWAPTARSRARRRGFDQSELLARALARRWRLPCRGLLLRQAGPPQAGRSALERGRNPKFSALRAVPPAVLLVDDVATTGATLTAAARALRSGGAAAVTAVVAARARGGSGM